MFVYIPAKFVNPAIKHVCDLATSTEGRKEENVFKSSLKSTMSNYRISIFTQNTFSFFSKGMTWDYREKHPVLGPFGREAD